MASRGDGKGSIRWKEVAKDKRVKYVFIRATIGKGKVDSLYRRNIKGARKAGLKVGSYHFFTSKSSATAQFLHFKSVVRKSEQDLIPESAGRLSRLKLRVAVLTGIWYNGSSDAVRKAEHRHE